MALDHVTNECQAGSSRLVGIGTSHNEMMDSNVLEGHSSG